MTDLETKLAEALRDLCGKSRDHEGHCFWSDDYADCFDPKSCARATEALAVYDAAKAKKPNKDMDWHLEPEEMDP